MRVIKRKILLALDQVLPEVLIHIISEYLLEHRFYPWSWRLRAVRFGQSWILPSFKYWNWSWHECEPNSCLCVVEGPWDFGINYIEPIDARPWDMRGDYEPIWSERSDAFMKRCGLSSFDYRKEEYKKDSFHKIVRITYLVNDRHPVMIQFIEPIDSSSARLLKVY